LGSGGSLSVCDLPHREGFESPADDERQRVLNREDEKSREHEAARYRQQAVHRGLLSVRLADGAEELAEAGRQFVLAVGPGLLERRGEGVRERPDRAGLELVVLRLEVVTVDALHEPDREFLLGEGPVEGQ
jgi:hypothetical protein